LKRVAVIGGGIAGLAAAHKLVESTREKSRDIDVVLLEKLGRLGGTILTEKHDGFVIEGGPDCFLAEKPWALALASRINVADRVVGTIEENKGTYIVWGSKLHPLPEGVMLMVPTRVIPILTSTLLTWRGKMRMGLDMFIPKRVDGKDESLAEFVSRRLGVEALERIAEPLVAGVHAGKPETMSLSAAFPRFKALEDEYGGLIRGMLTRMRAARKAEASRKYTMFVTFEKGLGDFVKSIADNIGDEKIRLNTPAKKLERAESKWRIHTASGEEIEADAVIVSSPAHVAAGILSGIHSDIAAGLKKIPYVGTATVSMAYDAKDVENTTKGFGFVVPRLEKRGIMAATFTSRKFPHRAPPGKALIRCFIGGAQRPDLVMKSHEELAGIAAAEIKAITGVKADPIWAKSYAWPESMPQTNVGHALLMNEINRLLESVPGLEIAGGAYEGLGIPDCVRVGEAAADRVAHELFSRSE